MENRGFKEWNQNEVPCRRLLGRCGQTVARMSDARASGGINMTLCVDHEYSNRATHQCPICLEDRLEEETQARLKAEQSAKEAWSAVRSLHKDCPGWTGDADGGVDPCALCIRLEEVGEVEGST